MRVSPVIGAVLAAGLSFAAPVFAQMITPDAGKQPAQSLSHGAAMKQPTQSLSHSDGALAGVTKQN